MGFAQRVALIDPRVVGTGPVIAVVDLAAGAVASLHGAARLSEQQRDALGCGGSPSQVGDVADVDAVGDDQLQDRLAQECSRRGHGDGSEAGDVAQLAAFDGVSLEGFEVDADEHEVATAARICGPLMLSSMRRSASNAYASRSSWRSSARAA